MAASEGAAALVVQTHSERLKEEQKRENQKKKEQELVSGPTTKSNEFSSGVKIGFANLQSGPVKPIKVTSHNLSPAPYWQKHSILRLCLTLLNGTHTCNILYLPG